MNAAVLVKHVPLGTRPLRVDEGMVRRDLTVPGIDPINEVPLEWALRAREAGHVDSVVAITMGARPAVGVLRKACAIGADHGVHVSDAALKDADVRLTAEVLAAAIRSCGASLALFGYESADGSSGMVPAAVAARLGWPVLSRVSDATVGDGGATLTGECDVGHGPERVRSPMPAVMSFVDGRIVPRFPKAKEMMRLRRAEFPAIGLAELGVVPELAGAERITAVLAVPFDEKESRTYGCEEGARVLCDLLESAQRGGT